MATRRLPSRPDLAQLKLQARELLRSHRAGSRPAAARVAAHHPRYGAGRPASGEARPLALADAQLVVSREYGFPSWARLKQQVDLIARLRSHESHPRFADALAALDAGDTHRLGALLEAYPELVHARTNLEEPPHYFSGATLLHHVAGNPGRERPLPDNVVTLARVLLDAGADVHARTLGPSGGSTMALLVTSAQASERGVSGPLMEVLLERGAELDLAAPEVLDASLANHAPAAALKMIELGARPDLFAAAALGRTEWLRGAFDARGRLVEVPVRNGEPVPARDAIGLALLYAYVRGQREAVDFLLERDGNWDVTGVNNGTALHRAAWAGDLRMVERLVARGADITNRDNPFRSTPLGWAEHNRQEEIVEWMRVHCRVDLHDAVCMDFPEHVEARLADDPGSVHAVVDQWDLPRGTALHWAARLPGGVDATPARATARERLVVRLLDAGAEVNALAGNGLTPLDIARAGGTEAIVAALERRGAKPGADL